MRRVTTPTLAALSAAALLTVACGDPTAAPSPSGTTAGPRRVSDHTGGEARLLACTPAAEEQRTLALVGPLGATVRLGNTSVEVPPGALLDETLLEVVVPATEAVEYGIHAVGVSHFVFESPVTVTLDYARCADALPPNAEPEGVYIRRDPYEVLEHMGGAADRDARTVTFTTGHLSGYAVAF